MTIDMLYIGGMQSVLWAGLVRNSSDEFSLRWQILFIFVFVTLYFIYDLFIDAVGNSAYIAPNGRVSKGLERMWKEAAVASFEDRKAD